MGKPSEDELRAFYLERDALAVVCEIMDIENSRPAQKLIDAVFELLELHVSGGRFSEANFSSRRILISALGRTGIENAAIRFSRQFSISYTDDYKAREKERLDRYYENELKSLFLRRVAALAVSENLHRDEALLAAARETQEMARRFYGTEPQRWRVVTVRKLQERLSRLAEPWEQGRGHLPPEVTADGRILPPEHSISDLKGKRGGAGKMRRRRT